MPDIGTYACYQTGCGHPACLEGQRQYKQDYRERVRAARYKGPDGEWWAPEWCLVYNKRVPHGTAAGYVHHFCRCPPCKKAISKVQADYYQARKHNRAVINRLFRQKGLW